MHYILETKGEKENNIIEVFGLQKAGKTTLLKKLKDKGSDVLNWEEISGGKKLFLFIKYILLDLTDTIYLFYKMNSQWIVLKDLRFKDYFIIFKMRNSYLVSALAKYEYLKKFNDKVFVDEFLLQSIFMIIQIQGKEKEIRKIINTLPLGDKITIVVESRRKRLERLKKVKNPATKLNGEFKAQWIENCEKNYEIIKKILLEKYVRVL